jgi:hypothetical protein
MREIQRLRAEQEAHAKSTADAQYNPTLLAELRLLRQRKDELESRMQALQESRKELMVQLEGLILIEYLCIMNPFMLTFNLFSCFFSNTHGLL